MTTDIAAIEAQVRTFVDRFAEREGGNLESVVLSPFPFCGSQLLVACKEHIPFLHEMAAASRLCNPPDVLTHWLRRSELRELSLPFFTTSIWFWWKPTGEYPGWSYWLRHRGTVFYGRDVRAEIPLPRNPRSMLEAVLLGSIAYNRALLPVPFLIREQYAELVEILAGLSRRLMATALLLCDQWEIKEATVLDQFSCTFGPDGAQELCGEMSGVFDGSGNPGDTRVSKQRAHEALWVTERLTRFLRRYVE